MCVGFGGNNSTDLVDNDVGTSTWIEQAEKYHRSANKLGELDLPSQASHKAVSLHQQDMSQRNSERCLFAAYLVCEYYSVDISRLLSSTRDDATVSGARQLAAYIAHTSFGISFTAISQALARDRTTISHACRTIEDRRDEEEFDKELCKLEGFVAVLLNVAADRIGSLSQSEIGQLILVTK